MSNSETPDPNPKDDHKSFKEPTDSLLVQLSKLGGGGGGGGGGEERDSKAATTSHATARITSNTEGFEIASSKEPEKKSGGDTASLPVSADTDMKEEGGQQAPASTAPLKPKTEVDAERSNKQPTPPVGNVEAKSQDATPSELPSESKKEQEELPTMSQTDDLKKDTKEAEPQNKEASSDATPNASNEEGKKDDVDIERKISYPKTVVPSVPQSELEKDEGKQEQTANQGKDPASSQTVDKSSSEPMQPEKPEDSASSVVAAGDAKMDEEKQGNTQSAMKSESSIPAGTSQEAPQGDAMEVVIQAGTHDEKVNETSHKTKSIQKKASAGSLEGPESSTMETVSVDARSKLALEKESGEDETNETKGPATTSDKDMGGTTIDEDGMEVDPQESINVKPVDNCDIDGTDLTSRSDNSAADNQNQSISHPASLTDITENSMRRERPKTEETPATSPAGSPVPTTTPVSQTARTTAMETETASTTCNESVSPPNPNPLDATKETKLVTINSASKGDDDEVDPFHDFLAPPPKFVKKSKRKSKELVIKIAGLSTTIPETREEEKKEDDVYPLARFRSEILQCSEDEAIARAEEELEDTLSFFRESHEDQDPAFQKFVKSQKQKRIQTELQEIETDDQKGRQEIEKIVAEQLKEKQASTDRQVERYKDKKITEEKNDQAKLQKLYTEKLASNQAKINQGIKVLKNRHVQETQKIMQQHRQQVQQRQIPEHMASKEWASLQQRLKVKQERQLQEFQGKGEEVKKRIEAEFHNEQSKIRKVYEKQMQDLDTNRREVYGKMYTGFQQLRQRYLKRHIQRMMHKKSELKLQLEGKGSSNQAAEPRENQIDKQSREEAAGLEPPRKEDKVALRPPSPIKSCGGGLTVNSFSHEKAGAASRHKHRKAMLSQISKQLSVEIHNEGVWVTVLSDKKDEKKKDADPHTESSQKLFLPWGIQARDFLESIVCGEIPSQLEAQKFDFGNSSAINGGHLRCVLTDLRTSDETAQKQRIEAVKEHAHAETASLQKKAADLHAAYTNAERMYAKCEADENSITPKVNDALKDYEAKKASWQNFRTKFAKFLGPDGNPIPQTNPSDRQKLTQAVAKYRGAVEAAEKRAKMGQTKLKEMKMQTQKYLALKKQSQRAAATAAAVLKNRQTAVDTEPPSTRVINTISALELVANKRRDQLNHKRTTSTSSSWIQSLPSVPNALRRSLWHKMHRRRQQIVLRPSQESLAEELKSSVVKSLSHLSTDARERELQKAEQAFLLSIHPLKPQGERIPTTPSTASWGEPGWHLVLDTVKPFSGQILPRAAGAPLVEKNLSEIHSAPGRQAASLIRTTHLRSLEAPLSAISTVTSLAESNPAVALSTQTPSGGDDPLNPTKLQLEIGYAFNPKALAPVNAPVPIRKKPSTSKEKSLPPTKAKRASSASTASILPNSSGASTASPGRSRKRKAATEPAKAAQRRKPVSSAKLTAAQSKATDAQQQRQRLQAQAQAKAQAQAQAQQRQQQYQLQQQKQQAQQQQNQQPPQQMKPPPQPKQQQPPQQNILHPVYQRQQTNNGMDNSQNSYTQFMNPMQQQQQQPQQQQQQHSNYQQQMFQQQQMTQQHQQQQFQPNQMAQLQRMQRQQQVGPQQQMGYSQPQHGMQSMPQYFQPMQQQFAPQPIGMPGQVVGPPGGMPMDVQGNNQVRGHNSHGPDGQNDPLFLLKDL